MKDFDALFRYLKIVKCCNSGNFQISPVSFEVYLQWGEGG